MKKYYFLSLVFAWALLTPVSSAIYTTEGHQKKPLEVFLGIRGEDPSHKQFWIDHLELIMANLNTFPTHLSEDEKRSISSDRRRMFRYLRDLPPQEYVGILQRFADAFDPKNPLHSQIFSYVFELPDHASFFTINYRQKSVIEFKKTLLDKAGDDEKLVSLINLYVSSGANFNSDANHSLFGGRTIPPGYPDFRQLMPSSGYDEKYHDFVDDERHQKQLDKLVALMEAVDESVSDMKSPKEFPRCVQAMDSFIVHLLLFLQDLTYNYKQPYPRNEETARKNGAVFYEKIMLKSFCYAQLHNQEERSKTNITLWRDTEEKFNFEMTDLWIRRELAEEIMEKFDTYIKAEAARARSIFIHANPRNYDDDVAQ